MAFYDSSDNWQPETLKEALQGVTVTDHPLCEVRLGDSCNSKETLYFHLEGEFDDDFCQFSDLEETLVAFDEKGGSYTLTVYLPEQNESDYESDRFHPALTAAERNPSMVR